MEDIIKRSEDKFEIIELSVFADNRARKLYNRLGFVEFGTLPNGLKRDSVYIDRVYMYLNIKAQLNAK